MRWRREGAADGGRTLFLAAASFSLALAASSSESGIAWGARGRGGEGTREARGVWLEGQGGGEVGGGRRGLEMSQIEVWM